MNQCKNLETCIQSITWAWLAAYGGREMQMPNCKTCNAYQPEERRKHEPTGIPGA